MAKLFWLLLAAAKGGYRYLRAILEAGTAYLKAKVSAAPGSPMEARLEVHPPDLTATPVCRSVADMQLDAEVEQVTLRARMVAWLLSDAVFRGTLEAIVLTTRAIVASASAMRGSFRADVKLNADMEAAPGSSVQFHGESTVDLTATAVAAVHAPMEAGLVVMPPVLEATAAGGTPDPVQADMAVANEVLSADIAPGNPAEIQAAMKAGTVMMTARMHTWSEPVATGTTLYIPQVYAVEENGTTLKLI